MRGAQRESPTWIELPRDVTNSAHHSVTKRLPTGHFTVVANGCIGGLDHKHGHAVKVLGQLQPLLLRTPKAVGNGNVPWLVKSRAVESGVATASVRRFLLANELVALGHGVGIRLGTGAVVDRGSVGARVHAHAQTRWGMAVKVERDKVFASHLSSGQGVDPRPVNKRAAWHPFGTLRNIVFIRRAEVQPRTSLVRDGLMVRFLKGLDVKAILVMKHEGLVGPRNRLVGVQERPHVMARPLPARVVPNVACWILLWNQGRGRPVCALARPESDRPRAHVASLVGRVVRQLPRRLAKRHGLLWAHARSRTATTRDKRHGANGTLFVVGKCRA
eukprot:m.87263 g.87263  ORF g.87263 m.87263 type:complete len:331 (-) comp9696_c1_seq2:770-1762(-)